MAEPHTLTFLFTKRRRTGRPGCSARPRLCAGSGGYHQALRAGSAGTIPGRRSPRLERGEVGGGAGRHVQWS